MKRQTGLLLGSALLLMAHSSWATICHNSNGTPTDVFYDLSNVFNSSNNRFSGNTEELEQVFCWSRFAVSGHTDHFAI